MGNDMGSMEVFGDDLGSSDVEPDVALKPLWTMFRQSYDDLVGTIIRPSRWMYNIEELGPDRFCFRGKNFVRTDFELDNPRGMTLQCSHWEPEERDRPSDLLPCVVYVHRNQGCRLEALELLQSVLSLGFTLLTFDASGSGNSGGQHISWGWFESQDLRVVIDHARTHRRLGTIALWGRSMGAAAIVFYLQGGGADGAASAATGRRPQQQQEGGVEAVKAVVLDSMYSDMKVLSEGMMNQVKEVVSTDLSMSVPSRMLSSGQWAVRKTVQKTAGFDMDVLRPIYGAGRCGVPCFFTHSLSDEFIPPSHTDTLYDTWKGPSIYVPMEGVHNSPKSDILVEAACGFLVCPLAAPVELRLPPAEGGGGGGGGPPCNATPVGRGGGDVVVVVELRRRAGV